MMFRVEFDLAAHLRSPFLFPGVGLDGWGYDVTALRDGQRRPLLPADQIKGVLRSAVAEMLSDIGKSPRPVAAIFGSGPEAEITARGGLVFPDLVAKGLSHDGVVYTRVEIDDRTLDAPGTVREGHMVVVELVAPPDSEVVVSGTVYGHVSGLDEAKDWLALLEAAGTRVSAIGSMKSAGFGEVVKIAFSALRITPLEVRPAPPSGEVCMVALNLDRPFLVNGRRVADNVAVGSDVIPGAVLKGALAQSLSRTGYPVEEDADFSKLSISHAIPEGAISRVLPLSWVWLPDENRFADVLKEPLLLQGKSRIMTSPDWKETQREASKAKLGVKWPKLMYTHRAHVRIDRNTGVAEDNALFFNTMVDPSEFRWIAQIDFGDLAQEKRALFWGAFSAGLDRIGSTGATAEVTLLDEDQTQQSVNAGECIVILETETVLAEPGTVTAEQAYVDYWHEVAGAEMIGFIAQQSFRGDYLGFREKDSYRAHVVTVAGSSFRLKVTDPARLEALARKGLPPRVGGQRPDWRTCPFQPENGWGRISIEQVMA